MHVLLHILNFSQNLSLVTNGIDTLQALNSFQSKSRLTISFDKNSHTQTYYLYPHKQDESSGRLSIIEVHLVCTPRNYTRSQMDFARSDAISPSLALPHAPSAIRMDLDMRKGSRNNGSVRAGALDSPHV